MADFGITEILGLAGLATSAVGTIAAGEARKSAADFQAKQLEEQGKEERAAAQRDALDKKKETDLLLSKQQSNAAASGLGALDDSVLDLAGDVAQQGAYQEGMIQYGGEERANGRMAQAAASRLEGDADLTGSFLSAGGTLMSGIGRMSDDYNIRMSRASSGYSGRYG